MTAQTPTTPARVTDTASSGLPMTAQKALSIIAEAARQHPMLGWEQLNALTDFQGRIMKRPGASYNNFVEALTPLGLTRDDAVDAFMSVREEQRRTKQQQDEERKRGPRAKPSVATPAAVPERPSEQVGNTGGVVHSQPAARTFQTAQTDADRLRQPGDLANNKQRPAVDRTPAAARSVRGKAKTDKPVKAVTPKPAAADETKQTSLF